MRDDSLFDPGRLQYGRLGGCRNRRSFKPGKLTKEEQAALQPGLTLRFYKEPNRRNSSLDARRVRLAALHVPAGGAPQSVPVARAPSLPGSRAMSSPRCAASTASAS